MTREEALAKLANELSKHRPHETYRCSCVALFKAVYPHGKITYTGDWTWETHVAHISFEYAKGF